MSTLSRQFPLVQCLCVTSSEDVSELIKPYLTWKMVTVDDYSSVLLTKHVGELRHSMTSDLIILIGDLAKEWLNSQSAQSSD